MAKVRGTKVPVSTRALLARINRKLRADDEDIVVRATRGRRAILDLGYYYEHDFRRNFALNKDLDLEQYGRELGVLREHETWDEQS
jgi:hypothetical protein